jgi:Raf kinase inhibitor-like YbhB/YbcL family protein
MRIVSSAFEDGQPIPREHSREGADRSPPLAIAGVPPEAQSLALIVDDPDAPAKTWVHWLAWGVAADRTGLPAGMPNGGVVSAVSGLRQGKNDFGGIGYGGPMPPRGHGPHRYRFTAYALRQAIELEPGATRDALERAMEGKVLETARLVGTYERS